MIFFSNAFYIKKPLKQPFCSGNERVHVNDPILRVIATRTESTTFSFVYLIKKIIFLSLCLLLIAWSDASQVYTKDQIRSHLLKLYQSDIEAGIGLKRWEQSNLKYYIGGELNYLTLEEKALIKNQMGEYGDMIGISMQHTREFGQILLLYTRRFLPTILRDEVERMLFWDKADDEKEAIYNEIVRSEKTVYSRWMYWGESQTVNRLFSIEEVTLNRREHLKNWTEMQLFKHLALRPYVVKSNIITPSLFNSSILSKHLDNSKITIIDQYYLEALYSKSVYYDMPIKQAIKVMTDFIYQKQLIG